MRQATEADNKLGIKGVSKGSYCSLAMLNFFLEHGRRNSSSSCFKAWPECRLESSILF